MENACTNGKNDSIRTPVLNVVLLPGDWYANATKRLKFFDSYTNSLPFMFNLVFCNGSNMRKYDVPSGDSEPGRCRSYGQGRTYDESRSKQRLSIPQICTLLMLQIIPRVNRANLVYWTNHGVANESPQDRGWKNREQRRNQPRRTGTNKQRSIPKNVH